MICCKKCGCNKSVSDFSYRNKSLKLMQPWCKDCQKVYKDSHYIRNKLTYARKMSEHRKKSSTVAVAIVVEFLLSHPCVDCGETDILVLEFDHVRGVKRWNISEMVSGGHSANSLLSEMKKCVIRCANCHRRTTMTNVGGWRCKWRYA